jgi:hypothetical protein
MSEEEVPWEQRGEVSRDDDGGGIFSRSTEDKAGWVGFFLYAIPFFLLSAGASPTGRIGASLGGGAVFYLLFYAGAKVVGKIRS